MTRAQVIGAFFAEAIITCTSNAQVMMAPESRFMSASRNPVLLMAGVPPRLVW
ncbi:MAG: hypothetical protein AB7P40_13355 [Chloroflexota bacterium]